MRDKKRNKIVRKISKVGRFSYAVVLPKKIVRKWQWRERQKVVLEIEEKEKKIVIEDWQKK